MGARSAFAAISAAWRGLTDAQRNAWNNATGDYPYQNKLGDTKTLSGFALHQKLNRNLGLIGVAPIASPLSPEFTAGPTDVVLTNPTAGTLSLKADLEASTSLGKVLIFATGPLSPGVNNFQKRLRVIGTETQSNIRTGIDITSLYAAAFGTPAIGAKVGVQVVNITTATGQASAPAVGDVIVTQ